MPAPDKDCRRSDCPLNVALEILGDRWTLLVLRDLVFKGATTFREFAASPEGIATNILADRLKKLQAAGIVTSRRSDEDARVVAYRPTTKGLDLLPTIVELILWSSRYEQTAAPPKSLKRMKTNRDAFIADVRAKFDANE